MPVNLDGRVEVVNPLGQLLLDAARLFEAIANYRGKKLLETYLFDQAALHPRRTLDQAYFSTLKLSDLRDRDQVLYRATTVNRGDIHRYDHKERTWVNHLEHEQGEACDKCRDNVRKQSRVIMVDQLWMWILDAQTIITCFPDEHGNNAYDASAVHKAIRVALEESRQIRTVFDLALIIISECSNTCFDRLKVGDGQLRLLDVFSKAIWKIVRRRPIHFQFRPAPLIPRDRCISKHTRS